MSMGGLGGKPTGLNTMNLNKAGATQAPKLPGQITSMPVAPQQNIPFENRALNQRGTMGVNQQARPLMAPVAPMGMAGNQSQLFNPNARSGTTAAYNARASASGIRR